MPASRRPHSWEAIVPFRNHGAARDEAREKGVDERLPQYLHKPVQILWFDAQEFILMMSTIFVAMIVGGLVGWGVIGALLLFIPWKRTKPRGFVPHLAWRWGLVRFRYYPGPTQTRFFE